MESSKYYDKHTVYVSLKGPSKEELLEFMEDFIKQAKSLIPKLNTEYRLNYVLNKENKPIGLAYIFFASKELYHLMDGKNPDGSDRVEITVLPENLEEPQELQSWADACDNTVKKELPPLIHNEMDDVLFARAYVEPLGRQYAHHILKCVGLPVWVDERTLKRIFQFYCSDCTKYKSRGKGRDYYPIIKIVEAPERICFVEFDSATHDAQFALLMVKRLDLDCEKGKATLYFCHSIHYDKRDK